jgi:hypothetical protein
MPEIFGKYFSRTELLRRVGRLEQVAGVRLATLGDGTERGVRVLEFRTGSGFVFEVLVDRAFDIGRCSQSGQALDWQSGTGFAGPWYGEPEDLGFLRTWGGGLLTTAGLDHSFFPARDKATQYHYPPKPTEQYGLHGRVSNRPARLTGYGERWEGDECILWANGEVLQATALGERLLLKRHIEARVGQSCLSIHDEVHNISFSRTPHMLLYHINFGFPLVDDDAEILLPARPEEAAGLGGLLRVDPPTAAHGGMAFDYDPLCEDSGIAPVGIINRRLQLGVYEHFRPEQLPHGLLWRMLAEGNYVVALEPSTNRSAGRMDARERDELIELEPGEVRSYDLELGILQGSEALDRFAERVNHLTGMVRS